MVDTTDSPRLPTRSENPIWNGMYPSSSLPSTTCQDLYKVLDGTSKVVSGSSPAMDTDRELNNSLELKSNNNVSPIMATLESLSFVDENETMSSNGGVPSNHTNEPSLVSVTSPVLFPAESSKIIEKNIRPSGSLSNISRVAIKSDPFCMGTTLESDIKTSTFLCGSDAVKNNESISPIPAESPIALFDDILILLRIGNVLSYRTLVSSVVAFPSGPVAPPRSVYAILKVMVPSLSLLFMRR